MGRRMISLEIIDTDAFLDMSVSAQLLYFHLNSRADDDGFVSSPKKIMRTIGASADDLKLLILKKFIITFSDGVCVIKHWRINNYIRKDIYKETNYLDLKKTLFIRSNGVYTQNNDGRGVPVPEGHFQLEDVFVNQASTLRARNVPLGKDRIGKDRKGKVSKDRGAIAPSPSEVARSFFEGGEHYTSVVELLKQKIPTDVVDREVGKFILYWTEPNKSGTKVRWEQQPTFEVKRRLRTWFERVSDKKQGKKRTMI